ncbi:hypothetical protein HYPSUDRAFT_209667 [Hypholoma sublateritium FD-334 SS-4]|uniref:Uncharacterized protein n=1 Tax=Hypholoma sublateritium (strain FD-334 SS-4) TaxID=945553 RepID=A0A0D2N9F6_HYPSF|nr:hypothetical protein HYPSUDRAFT_209667 [Hypholoma sublateritium FD-334 SS-4]
MASPSPPPPELSEALQASIKEYIAATLESSKKRPAEADSTEPPPLDQPETAKTARSYGRIYGRQDDPFTSIDTVVNFGIKYEIADEGEESNDERPTLSIRDERLLHSWKLLCSIVPGFRRKMLALSDQRAARRTACQEINDGLTTVRSDDTGSLKFAISAYLLADPNEPRVLIKSKLKTDRGFHNPVTASLLCPLKYPSMQNTYDDIKAGKLPVTATMLPRFLFPADHVYDPTDISKNLLRGHLMLRVAKHIFQGPSAALEEPGSHRGKQGNAAICGITSMSPYTIAYVATQVRFALSSTSSWTPRDGTFSYAEFYWHIVNLLNDDDEPEVAEIIGLFNYHVFGTENPLSTPSVAAVEAEDEYELIKRQRAAKRARSSQ